MKLSAALLAAVLPLAAAAGSIDKAKSFGNPQAPITIELFSDFQCPSCLEFHREMLPALMRDYIVPGKVYLVYKEFPLPMHNHSREAAAYACAAARVGKYQQVADALFQNQPTWAADGKVFQTVSTALTPAEQKKVLALSKDPSVLSEVQEDVQEGEAERVNGTPTMVLIHGAKKYQIPAGMNYSLLRSLLDSLAK
jgi:protein-disulfide isomerase